MTTYFVNWEIDQEAFAKLGATEARERTLEALKRVQSQLKSGELLEWKVFATGGRGYVTMEGGEVELYRRITQWTMGVPWLRITSAEPILSVEQSSEVFSSLKAMQATAV